MEVKSGYKQTEVGVIPEEWSIRPLGLICDVRDGTHESPRFFKDGVPFVTSKNIVDGRLDLENLSFISKNDAVEFDKRSKVDRNDILLSMIVTIGSAVLVDCEPDFCIKNVALIKPRKVAPTYLIRLINAPVFQKYLADNLDGGIQKFISLGKLRQLSIPLPDEAEQRAIATALSDVDGLLGGLDRLIAKKRDLKQAAMQQLLTGQTRLPGFAPQKASFRQTEVGMIPDDWKLTRLVDLVDPSRGIRYGIVQPGNYDPQGRYMIRGQDYSEVKGWASPTDVFRVSPGIEGRYRNSRVKTGDLIMTIVGYCGHVEMTPEWLDGANLTQTTARIAIQPDKAVSAFCKYMLLSPTGRNQVSAYMKGAAQPGLNCGDVEKFLIPIPPLPEQTAIASVLTEMDAELAGLEQRREKTRALKQAMTQELLTGRTRLV